MGHGTFVPDNVRDKKKKLVGQCPMYNTVLGHYLGHGTWDIVPDIYVPIKLVGQCPMYNTGYRYIKNKNFALNRYYNFTIT